MQKTLTIILLLAVGLLGLSSCEGSFIDPGASEMMDGGFGGGGSSGGGGGGGGELWSRLTAGSATWKKDNSSISMSFTKIKEDRTYGYCELSMSSTSGSYTYEDEKVYVKLNGAKDPWFGNLPGSKNISFGGGSSDTGTLTFSSNTAMTISGITSSWGSRFNGSYTRQ
jgi:hypothetical protein